MTVWWRQRASTTAGMNARRALFVIYVMVVMSFLASGFLGLFEAEADPGPVEDVVCLVDSALPDHPVVPECPSPSPTEPTPTQTVVSDPPCAFEPEGCTSPTPKKSKKPKTRPSAGP